MSGGLLGITKRWWYESGEYDNGMLMWGGENIVIPVPWDDSALLHSTGLISNGYSETVVYLFFLSVKLWLSFTLHFLDDLRNNLFESGCAVERYMLLAIREWLMY